MRPQGNRDLLRLDRPIHFVVVRWDPVRQLRRYVGEGQGGPAIVQRGTSAFLLVGVLKLQPLDDFPEHPGENTVDWRRVLHRPPGVARDKEEDDNAGEALTDGPLCSPIDIREGEAARGRPTCQENRTRGVRNTHRPVSKEYGGMSGRRGGGGGTPEWVWVRHGQRPGLGDGPAGRLPRARWRPLGARAPPPHYHQR